MSVGLFIACCLVAGKLNATDLPGGAPEDADLAINKPDDYAWKLFFALNRQAADGKPGEPDPTKAINQYDDDKPVVWESWALASGGRNGGPLVNPTDPNYSEVFLNDGKKPLPWGAWPRTAATKHFEPMPAERLDAIRQALNDSSLKSGAQVAQLHPNFVPVPDQAEGDEVRMNRGTYDFVRDNQLYNVEGLEAQFVAENSSGDAQKPPITFPKVAQEVKAQWRVISDADKPRYHWRTLNDPSGQKTYGLVALHIITKDLPNWFWTDFVHVDYDRESEIPGADSSSGKNADGSQAGTEGTKWAQYRLRGAQVDFTDSRGRATLLANPLIEKGFQQTSSCISCHSRATVGLRSPDNLTRFKRLRTFLTDAAAPPSVVGAIGTPDFRWYLDPNGAPLYVQTDFLWSIPFRALKQPTSATKPESARQAAAVPNSGTEKRKVFATSVVPLQPNSERTAALALVINAIDEPQREQELDIYFSFAIPTDAHEKLKAKVLKAETVDPRTLEREFSASPQEISNLVAWLKDHGFEITKKARDGIFARASVKDIESNLDVRMVRVTKNGLTSVAAATAPSLPEDVAEGVQAIIGLQPFLKASKKSIIYQPGSGAAGFHPSIANAPPYLVKELLKAYSADGLGATGKDQKIAILIDRLPDNEDTKHFWTKNGFPVDLSRIEPVNVREIDLPPPDGEESMDLQWASSIAPEAKVAVYAAGSLEFVHLDLALDRILEDAAHDPQLRQLSISLGLGEQFLSPDGALEGQIKIENDKFLELSALGVNVFVSSGDGGSNPDQFGRAGGLLTQTEWMSSSPFVVAVGGTALSLSGSGGVGTEKGWAGSGGGISKVFPRPDYQSHLTLVPDQRRLVPDVGLVAAPETGAYVRVNGTDNQIGGTSLSAPVWAGFCALINDARIRNHKSAVGFLNPLIYRIATEHPECFRDISDGTINGKYATSTGYDMVTGLGVPDVKELATKLP